MTPDISRLIAVLTVWCESRGEGEAGMQAVSHAIANRHHAGKWYSGKTLAECCLIPLAFSCWNAHDPNRIAMSRLTGDEPILADIDGYLADALNGFSDDPTYGATHYHDTSIKPPPWALAAVRTATIGRLTFYSHVN